MKELLRFEEIEQTGKTKRFIMISNHSNQDLGVIHWDCGWRCYVISYRDNVRMSLSCNKELNIFMEKLENERKNNVQKN